MANLHPIQAAIFDMDGLLIDSEPLWLQAELDIFNHLGLNTTSRELLPNTLGLRIDQVVKLWHKPNLGRSRMKQKSAVKLLPEPFN